ncbi:MFS transporter [Cohnella nanjingensis]|uniref:MFS transporter n=1 Tax=Cohnella nanjingensis TaxID=1387779 RepID=A0A7X0RSR1_9BACL|nr:MFS transporter [Cohnella nanjingensis]MBB6672823.1 MFS transporter [Cohnella nanjingensis]
MNTKTTLHSQVKIEARSDGSLSAPLPIPSVGLSRRHHLIFAAATLLYWVTMYIYVPILTPFLEDRGLPMGMIGFIVGSYGLTQMLIRFPLGLYSDRLQRRKPFLFIGMLAGLGSCVLFLTAGGWAGPLAGRLVAGICASTWVAFSVLYASYFAPDQSTKAMGSLSFLTVTGQLTGMTASGYLASQGGWNAAFATGIGVAAVGALMTLFVHEPKTAIPAHAKKGDDVPPRSWIQLLRESPLLIEVSLLSILAHCILFITMFGFTPLQAVKLGASEAQLTWLVIAFMVPHALVSLWTGRYIAPRFGIRPVIIAGFLLAAVCTAAISYSGSLPGLLLTQMFNGIGQALYFPLLLGLAIRDIPPRERATAMGFYQSMYSIGMFAGPYLAGWLNGSGGLRAGFAFGAAIGLIGAAITGIRARYYRV